MCQNLNIMTDNIPIYRMTDSFDNISKDIHIMLESFFMKNLNILQNYTDLQVNKDFLNNSQKYTYNYNISNDNKNLLLNNSTDLSIKPLKKF